MVDAVAAFYLWSCGAFLICMSMLSAGHLEASLWVSWIRVQQVQGGDCCKGLVVVRDSLRSTHQRAGLFPGPRSGEQDLTRAAEWRRTTLRCDANGRLDVSCGADLLHDLLAGGSLGGLQPLGDKKLANCS